jgi:hypothetical protein
MKWLRSLFTRKKKYSISPREFYSWHWGCYNCDAGGDGTEFEVSQDSTAHLLGHAHAVWGGIK